MPLIALSITRPIAVLAAVLMVVLFGYVGLTSIPIQLAPDVNRPVVRVNTNWPGAAPAEVEREVVIRQEEALKGLEGVKRISSRARSGSATVWMEFQVGLNMDRALLLVSNRLDTITGYPPEVDQPTLSTATNEDDAIARFALTRLPGNERELHTYGDFIDDVIRERLERVPGIADSSAWGGNARQMQVIVEPEKLARYGLTVSDIAAALRAANASVSAGNLDEGKRTYVVRTEGEFSAPEQIRATVVRSEQDTASGRVGRVTIDDVAEVRLDYAERNSRIRYMGERAIVVSVSRETGANVMETMDGIREAIAELEARALPEAGLKLTTVYDETTYIESSIDLVRTNIFVGGTLAALVLLLFLRSLRATLVVSLAIPVSVIGSFVAMAALGRSINVISLAGMAFAVGMVVDAAIVVLENIYRLRQQGLPSAEAALKGASQVWGAVLVSALTTVMVFVPILLLELEVGQLFRDIAVAISVSVLLSLVVAVTVIPTLATRLLERSSAIARAGGFSIPLIDPLARGFVRLVLGYARAVTRRRSTALGLVLSIAAVAAVASWVFLPKLEYLPEGNRNFIFGAIQSPPGYNLATSVEIAEQVEDTVRPLWSSVSGPESEPGAPPKIQDFFFFTRGNSSFVGAASVEPDRVAELIPVLREPIFREPGTFGFMGQPSIFGRGLGGGRSIDLDISGAELETILDVARRAAERIEVAFPRRDGHQFRPQPGLELGAPELRVFPDRVRLADAGVTARELGESVDAFNDGMRVAQSTVDGRRIDLMLMGRTDGISTTQGIDSLPVVTRQGAILPVSALAEVRLVGGPTEIRREERKRTVTLEVRPGPGIALEAAMDRLRDEVIAPVEAAGVDPGISMTLSGTADKLTETWNAMVWQLVLAVAIVYLVMAILFESFAYPLIVMITVPVAAAGGVAGLAVVNAIYGQALDMLTILGFVILVGIVVNNAILLVSQSLVHLREEGLGVQAAIQEATRNRIRPIFMSTLTSIFGMFPLVVFPGAGSELYRGIGAVVIGGLGLTTVVTLFLVPPLLSVFMGTIEGRSAEKTGPAVGEVQPAE